MAGVGAGVIGVAAVDGVAPERLQSYLPRQARVRSHKSEPFGFGETAFNLRAGQLLLFPSYLMHEVAPYFGQRERITVAFNAWVREAGSDEPGIRQRS